MLSSVSHAKCITAGQYDVGNDWRNRTICFVKYWLIKILSEVSTLFCGELLNYHKIPNNRTYILTGIMTGVIAHSVVYNGNLVTIPKVTTNSKLQNITLNLIFSIN